MRSPSFSQQPPPAPPSLFPADARFDPVKLEEEFAGPLAPVPPGDAKDVCFTVGRLLPRTETTFATLAEAVAAAPEGGRTVVTIIQ